MEIAAHKSTSSSLQHDDVTDGLVTVSERWQVDPYLDTRGPEYSWMYTESPENVPTVEMRPPEKVHGSQ